jgi:DNA end-binding protein Ku
MPAARPIWKGQLRLSLVAIPVELYSATKSSAKVQFRRTWDASVVVWGPICERSVAVGS